MIEQGVDTIIPSPGGQKIGRKKDEYFCVFRNTLICMLTKCYYYDSYNLCVPLHSTFKERGESRLITSSYIVK